MHICAIGRGEQKHTRYLEKIRSGNIVWTNEKESFMSKGCPLRISPSYSQYVSCLTIQFLLTQSRGISYLDVKNILLLSYNCDLINILKTKSEGRYENTDFNFKIDNALDLLSNSQPIYPYYRLNDEKICENMIIIMRVYGNIQVPSLTYGIEDG